MSFSLPELQTQKYRSEQGTLLYTHNNPKTPLISIEICVQSGSLHEQKSGEANLLLACLFKGSQTMSHADFSQALESLGGSLSLRCTPTAQYIRIEILRPYAPQALQWIWESLQTPLFLDSEIKKEKELLLSQLKNAEESPAYLAQKSFLKQIYGHASQALLVDGSPDSLSQITREDLLHYHRSHYRFDNIVIALSGQEPDTLIATLDSSFTPSDSPRTPSGPLALNTPPSLAHRHHILTPDKDQCVVLMGSLGISRRDPDFMALMILDVLLGQGPGFSSRLPQILRDQQGLVYHLSFSATQNAHLYPGIVQTYLECSPDKVEKCIRQVNHELIRACEEPVALQELQTIQTYLQGQLYFCFETNAQRCGYFLHKHTFGWSDHHLTDYLEQLHAVTPEHLQQAAQRQLKNKQQTIITAGPSPLD